MMKVMAIRRVGTNECEIRITPRSAGDFGFMIIGGDKQSYEGTLTAWEAEKARADAAEGLNEAYKAVIEATGKALIEAEAREQRLKEEIEYEIEICTLRGSDARAEELKELLSTLYPDTPAPKEGDQ